MIDGNTWALNNHEQKQDQQDRAFNRFLEEIEENLKEMERLKAEIINESKQYDGFDFEEDAIIEIKERLNL